MLIALKLGDWSNDLIENVVKYFSEIVGLSVDLLSRSPLDAIGGQGMTLSASIYDSLMSVGTALMTVFFFAGVFSQTSRLVELKRPEMAVKFFVRFAVVYALINQGMDLVKQVMAIVAGMLDRISGAGGVSLGSISNGSHDLFRYSDYKDQILRLGAAEEAAGVVFVVMFGLVLVGIMFMFVYTVLGRLFKIWIYVAVLPISCSTLASETTSHVGKAYLKNFLALLAEALVIVVALKLAYDLSPAVVDMITLLRPSDTTTPFITLFQFIFRSILVAGLVIGIVKAAESLSKELFGGQ